MDKVLVFGGSGFLGHYLVKELQKRGYEVTVADIRQDDSIEVKYVKCDISKREEVESVFESDDFQIVYNLAGLANIDRAIENPLKTMDLNIIANIYMLEASLKYGIKKFIYASSAYAMSNKGSFYGISKLASEKIIEEYNKKYGLSFVILRYGSVYSERSYDNNYIYNLVKTAVKEGVINHKGDGQEIREYIHAADAAKLSVDIIESNKFLDTHVILTGTERMKRIELFSMIKEIMNSDLTINCSDSGEYKNHYKFTPYSFTPTLSQKLVANPHIDMGQGLLECIRAAHKDKKYVMENVIQYEFESFAEKSADYLYGLLKAGSDRGTINVALSGGSTPMPILHLLKDKDLNWENISFYIVDERDTEPNASDCNYHNLNQYFLQYIPSPSYPIVKGDSADESAIAYNDLLNQNISKTDGFPQFDVILLGMGEDGHTASLFPNTKALQEFSSYVVANDVPQLNARRITFTFPVILNAKKIVLLTKGEKKKEIIDGILSGEGKEYPMFEVLTKHKNINCLIGV